MKVVLDANIIVADPWLAGADFRWLSTAVDFAGWTLCVPRLALDEAVNKYQERLAVADRDVAKAEQELAKLLGQPDGTSARVDRTPQVSKYKAHLLTRLREMSARVLPYPRITHRELVKRALARRKPFNEKGAGYRDALIWQTVLALVDGKQLVAFISNDSGDFFHREGRAHPDLVQDLEGHDPEAHPRLYRTLHEFLEKEAKQHFAEMESLKDELNLEGRHGPIDIRAAATNHLAARTAKLWLDPKPFNPDASHARVLSLESVARVEVTAVRRLSVREVVVDLVAECRAVLEFIWERDDSELPWEQPEDDGLSYESAALAVLASLVLDLRDGSVRAVDVHGAGPATSRA